MAKMGVNYVVGRKSPFEVVKVKSERAGRNLIR